MHTQLSYGTADYAELMYIPGQKTMPSTGIKRYIEHQFEDGRVAVVNVSSLSFDVEVQFDYINDTDREFLLDFFHNTAKANGSGNTFYWHNPIDNIAYVARFLTPLRTVYKPASINAVETMKMRISAYYGPSLSDYTDMKLYVESGTYMDFV